MVSLTFRNDVCCCCRVACREYGTDCRKVDFTQKDSGAWVVAKVHGHMSGVEPEEAPVLVVEVESERSYETDDSDYSF